jgi:hypothetical protein
MTKAELAAHVVKWIEAQGITVSGGSRLDRMRTMLVRPDGSPAPFIAPGEKDFDVALEAERDLQMLGFASDQLASESLPSNFRTRLKLLLKDTALPQDGSANTAGRDVQCELYVAAICMKAGTSPTFDEPDVCCTVDGLGFGIAVKRIKSPGMFKERIREAVKQIERASLPGIVVADVSVMLNPTNERIIQAVSDDVYHAAAKLTMHNFVDGHHAQLSDWFKGSKARGLILIDHHVRQHPADGWGLDTMTFGVNLSPHNQRRRREFDRFFAVFKSGTATPAASSA